MEGGLNSFTCPQMKFEETQEGNTLLTLGWGFGRWTLAHGDGQQTWESLKDPEPVVPPAVWACVWYVFDIYQKGGGESMHDPIEVGAKWDQLNETRQELQRVASDLFGRKYDSPEQAMIAGEIREAFNNADEAIFNVINIATAQDDPQAKDALASSLAAGLTATRSAQTTEQVRDAQS